MSNHQCSATNHALHTLYRYVINRPCHTPHSGPTSLVVLVTSNARNVGLRSAQREAFPSFELRRRSIKRLFLLARDDRLGNKTAEDRLHQVIQEESNIYEDIIQGDFQEDYKNLTYKHLMGLSWAATYCQGTRWVWSALGLRISFPPRLFFRGIALFSSCS